MAKKQSKKGKKSGAEENSGLRTKEDLAGLLATTVVRLADDFCTQHSDGMMSEALTTEIRIRDHLKLLEDGRIGVRQARAALAQIALVANWEAIRRDHVKLRDHLQETVRHLRDAANAEEKCRRRSKRAPATKKKSRATGARKKKKRQQTK